jgi:biotin transport system substrate-specific component
MTKEQFFNHHRIISQNVVLQVILGVMILFATSQLSIDIKPVPIVMTTVGVMLIGFLYTPMTALYSTTIWLTMGSLGAPMFANYSSGLFGITMGYKIGMAIAAPMMALIRTRYLTQDNFLTSCLIAFIGSLIIYAFGLSWMAYGFNLGAAKAIEFGLLPFIIPGIVKIFILVSCLKFCRISK